MPSLRLIFSTCAADKIIRRSFASEICIGRIIAEAAAETWACEAEISLAAFRLYRFILLAVLWLVLVRFLKCEDVILADDAAILARTDDTVLQTALADNT